jgi:GT2 family glycosyltransferase
MTKPEHPPNSSVDVLIRSTGRPELQKALHSLALQSHTALHVYVADAAAVDLEVNGQFPFPLEVVKTGQKMSRSQAANALLNESKSPYALFLDEDDWLLPQHIANLVNGLEGHPEAVMAYSDTRCVQLDADGQETVLRDYVNDYSAVHLMLENYIPIHAGLFRRTLDTKKCLFDTRFDLFEDWDYWLQLQQLGAFVRVPDLTAVYLIHGDSGAGVVYDNKDEALTALRQILQKWQGLWTPDQLKELWGYSRQISALQKVNLQLNESIQQEHEENAKKRLQVEEHYAQERDTYERKIEEMTDAFDRAGVQHAQKVTNLSIRHDKTVENYEQEIAKIERIRNIEVQRFENSLSWRITKPLRWLSSQVKSLGSPLLAFLTYLYKSDLLYPFLKWIPSSIKRKVRNRLMYLSHQNRSDYSDVQPSPVVEISENPKVSIVIPIFNHYNYLRQCIESALAQTYQNKEIILIDDRSSDPAVIPLLEEYADKPGVRLIRNSVNQGISETQNKAIIESSGAIIAFLDCDDFLAPEAITTCIENWKSNTVYLHTGRINIDKDGAEINRTHFMSLPRQNYFAENLRAMYATHLKMIRRDVFAKVGLFDPRFDSAQDYEMLMRIAFHYPTESFVHVPDFLYHHRIHNEQTTTTQNSKQLSLTAQIKKEAKLRENIRLGHYQRFVSIIMLSYGKHTQTLQALQGLEQTVKIPHEVILYDNGSTAETVDFLKTQIDGQFSNVKVFYGDTNLGPAQGRRQALEHASGEWFIIFDNDEIPEPGWIEELLLRAESNPQTGAVCCRVTFPDGRLQFSGGKVDQADPTDVLIDLGLHDYGKPYSDLSTCGFREVDWCPIGATLFTVNIAPYLHDGYPNTFEDAGVSFALKKAGYRLLNAPGALVWHEHITFRPDVEMGKKYMADRYNPKMMLKSVASFYAENQLIIKDEYIWRENGLNVMTRPQLLRALNEASLMQTRFNA